uniref:Fasciclin-2 n=1 Tax=Trichogramma kaykai TaxID=54128 RepID=A0ABD2XID3_9HYME
MTFLLLLFHVCAVEARAQDRNTLEILPNGEVLTKAVGSSILLTCKPQVADTKLISDIQWLDPSNRPVDVLSAAQGYSKPSMYTEIHQDNSLSLFFNSLKEEQAGKYICRAMYANTQLLTKTVTIETIVAITWDNAPENQYPILGEDFAIRCQVRARPSPTVDWLYNGEVIRTNDHYVIETHALRIKNVKESDDGIYTCRASVPQTGELQERTIRVEVHTRPKIEEYDTNVEITEGENANIICKAIGKPPPKFSWIKSLTKENLAITDRFGVNEDTGVLTVTNVRREDTGEYQCTATNLAGMDSITIQVTVIVKPKIMEFLNQTVAEGEQATLACRAFGRPPPSITFRKHTADRPYIMGAQPDDDRIVLRNQADEQKGETLGELIIDQTLRSNDGLYECIATNKGGVAIKNGHLTTEFKPSFASMTNRTYYSWDQLPINLTCIAESIPNATIRWTYYGDVSVERDPNIVVLGNGPVSTITVTPRDRRLYAIYKCIAVNKHGEAQHQIELREAPKPADVQQVIEKGATATTVTFEIVPPVAPQDLPIRTLTVQYRRQDTSWQTALNRTWAVIGQQGRYVVEDLQPQTMYDFRFAATNDAGRGNWAKVMHLGTLSRDVPGPVRFLPTPERDYLVSHFPDRYNLKWSAAPDNGERIDYYDIKWCEAKKYTGNHWEVQDNTCQNKQEGKQDTWISNLYPDTFYKITVRAHNILGLGQASNMTIKTTRGTSGNASVLHHQGSLISSSAIIGIVVAILLILLLIIDAVLCCTCKSGLIYYFCELSRRKPIDEEDAKLGSLYGWRFPLPYCDQKLANVAGVTAIQDSGSGKSTITLVKHTSIDEKEPLREEKMITSIIDTNGGANGGITTTTTTTTNGPTVMTNGNGSLGVRESSVTFDGKRSISKTGFVGKDSAV